MFSTINRPCILFPEAFVTRPGEEKFGIEDVYRKAVSSQSLWCSVNIYIMSEIKLLVRDTLC